MEIKYSLPLTFLYHERESIKRRLMEKKYLLILTFLYQYLPFKASIIVYSLDITICSQRLIYHNHEQN